MTTETISLQVTISDELVKEVIDTACFGGINYWCDRMNTVEGDGKPLTWEFLEQDEKQPVNTDPEGIRKAMLGLQAGTIQAAPRYGQAIADALVNPEDAGCYIDADVADVIVQAALFGDIRYG